MRWPLWIANTAFTHLISSIPLWALAPPPRPFMLFPLPPRPNLSIQAFRRGIVNWGGSRATVFRMSVSSECARQASKRFVSEECKACMRVRVREWAGMTNPRSFFFFFPPFRFPLFCVFPPTLPSRYFLCSSLSAFWSPSSFLFYFILLLLRDACL